MLWTRTAPMLALGLSSAATGAPITVDTDKRVYTPGQTITVTEHRRPINFSFGFVSAFGATPTFGANAASAWVLIPEPGAAALLGLGLGGLAFAGRRRSRARRLCCGSPGFDERREWGGFGLHSWRR